MTRNDYIRLATAIGYARALNPGQGDKRFVAELMQYLSVNSGFSSAKFVETMREAETAAIAQKRSQQAAEASAG